MAHFVKEAGNDGAKTSKVGRVWAVLAFAVSMAAWIGCVYGTDLVLMDTNVGMAIALLTSAVVSIPAFFFSLLSRRRGPVAVSVLVSVVILALCATPWHPRKRFLNDFHGLLDPRKADLTLRQVRERMSRYVEIPCGHRPVDSEDSVCYRWNTKDRGYQREVGEVWIIDGHVSRLEFRSR